MSSHPPDAADCSTAQDARAIERVMALADSWEMERSATHPIYSWSPAEFAAELRRVIERRP